MYQGTVLPVKTGLSISLSSGVVASVVGSAVVVGPSPYLGTKNGWSSSMSVLNASMVTDHSAGDSMPL